MFSWEAVYLTVTAIRGVSMHKAIAIGVGVLFASLSTQASALNTRTWISGHGIDQTGCGPIASPCRTLQYAHDATNAGGEIDVLDPAGYGALVITKAINVVNEGVGVAGALSAAGGNAITISAGAADNVFLRGLSVEGAGTGANGIVFNSGGNLTITNCTVMNFSGTTNDAGNGIKLAHSAGTPKIVIAGTTIANNPHIGVLYLPSGTGAGKISVDHSTFSNNGYGFNMYTAYSSATGGFAGSISNSFLTGNDEAMQIISGSSSQLQLSVDNISAFENSAGISTNGPNTVIILARSSIQAEFIAGMIPHAGTTIYTYNNNYMGLNGITLNGATLNTLTPY